MSKGLFFDMEVKPYRYGLIVSIGQDRKGLKESLDAVDKKFKIKRSRECMMEFDLCDDSPGFVRPFAHDSFVCLKHLPTTVETSGTMVHELLHVVRFCLKRSGINMGRRSGSEAYCYLLEDLHNEFLKRVDEHLK